MKTGAGWTQGFMAQNGHTSTLENEKNCMPETLDAAYNPAHGPPTSRAGECGELAPATPKRMRWMLRESPWRSRRDPVRGTGTIL